MPPRKRRPWIWPGDPNHRPGKVARRRLAAAGKQFLAEKKAREEQDREDASLDGFIDSVKDTLLLEPEPDPDPVAEEDFDEFAGFGDTEERTHSDGDEEEGNDDDVDGDEDELPSGECLYPGSKLSALESATILYAFAMRHCLSKDGIVDLLNLMKLHLPEEAKVPGSQYLLEKALCVNMSTVTKCFYCMSCESPVSTKGDVCEECHARINETELIKYGKYFLMFDIRHSLQKVLELKEVSSNLVKNLAIRTQNRSQPGYVASTPSFYADIVDGDWYRKLPLKDNDITCSFNTDGVNVFKSSTFSIWPIFLSFTELSYKIRRNHTVLVGMWFGKKKPSFQTFLTPFVDQCNQLSTEGLSWNVNGLCLNSRVFFVIIAADSVARAPLQGLKQFNGKFGCPFCYNPGKSLKITTKEGGSKFKWIYPPLNAEQRTVSTWRKDLQCLQKLMETNSNQNNYHGVLGPSAFFTMRHFDIVNGCVVDYMHTALLGVLKTYTTMLIDSKNHTEDYYLGTVAQAEINARLVRCKIPSEVNRVTRDLKDVAYWKANEWKTWLLICIPILQGILKDPYIEHLSKFVSALSLLISDKISPQDIDIAEKLLKQFNRDAPTYYSNYVLTFNMHLITHAAECVRKWGPLWGYSLFQFEHANGLLGKMFKGTRVVGMQIVKNATVMQEIRSVGSASFTNGMAKLLLDSMIEHKTFYSKAFQCNNGVTFVGPRKNYTFNEQEIRTLGNQNIPVGEIKEVWSYKNMFFNGKRFGANESSKISNSVIKIGKQILIIRKFFLLVFSDSTHCSICFVNPLNADLGKIKYFKSKLVYNVTNVSTALKVARCQDIENVKFITLFNSAGRITHVCKLANSVELE